MKATRFAVAALVVLAGCGDDGAPGDPAVDAAVIDAAPGDRPVDAAADAPLDAMVDATIDATVDATVDATSDATVDATPCRLVPSSGTYLLGAQVNAVGAPVPLGSARFRAVVTYTRGAACAGSLDAVLQPLDRTTVEPIGAPIESREVAVDADGAFVMPVVGTVPGGATTFGVPLDVDGALTGAFTDADHACGSLGGEMVLAGSRLPLDGDFAMALIDSSAPLPPATYRCAD
jgi:hypothetical protein